MVKSRTPAADISFVSCFRKAIKGMDSSCSSGYSSASIAVNTGCCSSSLQYPSRSVSRRVEHRRTGAEQGCTASHTALWQAKANQHISALHSMTEHPVRRGRRSGPGHADERGDHALIHWPHELGRGLGEARRVQRQLHVLEARQQLCVRQDGEGERLRHGARRWCAGRLPCLGSVSDALSTSLHTSPSRRLRRVAAGAVAQPSARTCLWE